MAFADISRPTPEKRGDRSHKPAPKLSPAGPQGALPASVHPASGPCTWCRGDPGRAHTLPGSEAALVEAPAPAQLAEQDRTPAVPWLRGPCSQQEGAALTIVTPVSVPGVADQPVGGAVLHSPAQDADGVASHHLSCDVLVHPWERRQRSDQDRAAAPSATAPLQLSWSPRAGRTGLEERTGPGVPQEGSRGSHNILELLIFESLPHSNIGGKY